ncbi:hypothetical protein LOTGIDRAFT_111412 [Lottia gigantea]|uniref:TMEM205-like domain-containing protein n=1 Tax=Lottia gigantea TaxID=225164 RepID=V4B451_LOTGI|nr:hypothetical protein LOTGIDRAFT_111412 [Lottia gigantea]ESP02216.1 hypothetical protein LOTGIDRAFT_111412 [Lottia gigantea]
MLRKSRTICYVYYFLCIFRISHIHYLALAVMALFVSFLSYPSKRHMDPTSTLITFTHLMMFTAQLGAQLWVTLVAGITMFCSLPRRMFGQVQKRLFPMFFFWCYVTSVLTISTFLCLSEFLMHLHVLFNIFQMYALAISFLSATANTLVLAPLIVTAMVKTFDMEVTAGVGDIIGYADIKDLKSNEEYLTSYSMFRKCHGVSACLTVVALLSNTYYLYSLSSSIVLVDSLNI